jgi:hypothetical protein
MKLQTHIDYKAYPQFIKDLGIDAITEAEATAAKTEVKACPFCGSDPELYLADFYGRPCAAIQCSRGACKVKTQIYSAAPTGLKMEPVPISECVINAAKAWNCRAQQGENWDFEETTLKISHVIGILQLAQAISEQDGGPALSDAIGGAIDLLQATVAELSDRSTEENPQPLREVTF